MEPLVPVSIEYWLTDDGEILRRETDLGRAVAGLWGRNSPTAIVLEVRPLWNLAGRIPSRPFDAEEEALQP